MRVLLVLFICVAPLTAGEGVLAEKFPAGASAYFEVSGLGKKIDAVLASPLFKAVSENATIKYVMASPQVKEARAKFDAVRQATGYDELGLLYAVAGRRIAVAIYGDNARIIAMARMDAKTAEKIMTAAEKLSGLQRKEARPAENGAPAIYLFGPIQAFFDGDCLVVTPNPLLANAVRNRVARGLDTDQRYVAAREHARGKTLFGYADLTQYKALIEKYEKPKELGSAFLLGAFAHHIKRAPWAAVSADLVADGEDFKLVGEAVLPAPRGDEAVDKAVDKAFRGTLAPLPFALPERTVGMIRMRRDLSSIWSNREELIAKRGIPGLVEFETNFGNLAGGISWVEEVLPNLGDEYILVGTRRIFKEGEPAPAARFPAGAMLIPLKNAKKLGPRLQIAFNNLISIINIQQGMMGYSFLQTAREYKGVRILEADYMDATKGEMEGKKSLPPRFNLKPACAAVGNHFVLASHSSILEQIIDGYGKPGPAPEGVNAGIWLKPREIHMLLEENREPLIAQSMVNDGSSRAEAEGKIKLLLDLSRYVKSFQFVSAESNGTIGLRLEIGLGAPWDTRRCKTR